MDYLLTDDQRAHVERLERVFRERIAPRATQTDRDGRIPEETWRDLRECGYFALFHPTDVGGAGVDGVVQGLAMEALARACASTFWSATISSLLCGKMLWDLCTPGHHAQWLAPIVAGEKLGCFAASEDGAGSDPSSYRTTLTQTARGFRLNGVKSRISNAGNADVAVVVARRDSPTSASLCYVVVDLGKQGVRRTEIPKTGLTGMPWGTLQFEDVEIDREDVILNASLEKTLVSVEWGQLLQAWCAIGIAQAALDECTRYVQERHSFGRPIAHLQVVHARLAEMRMQIDASRLLALEVSWVKGAGRVAREAVLMSKINATEMAVTVADLAMRVFAGWGFSKDQIIERLYRDSLANVPAGLPSDRLREFVACAMVGVDPWAYEPFDWLTPAGLRID